MTFFNEKKIFCFQKYSLVLESCKNTVKILIFISSQINFSGQEFVCAKLW